MKRAVRTALLLTLSLSGLSNAQAALLIFTANLNGASENPPNASLGSGFTQADFDSTAHTMRLLVTFSGLTGQTTAAHIHSPAVPPGNAGVATQLPSFAGFPLGVTSGSYNQTFDMTLATNYNPTFITDNGGNVAGEEAALLASMKAGTAYLNIHSTEYHGGEIRGFLSVIPEPAPWRMMIGGYGLSTLALR